MFPRKSFEIPKLVQKVQDNKKDVLVRFKNLKLLIEIIDSRFLYKFLTENYLLLFHLLYDYFEDYLKNKNHKGSKDELENFLKIFQVLICIKSKSTSQIHSTRIILKHFSTIGNDPKIKEFANQITIMWILSQIIYDKELSFKLIRDMYFISDFKLSKTNCLLLNSASPIALKTNILPRELIPSAIFPAQIFPIYPISPESSIPQKSRGSCDPNMLEFVLERAIWECNNPICGDENWRRRSFQLMFEILITEVYQSIFPEIYLPPSPPTTTNELLKPFDIYGPELNPYEMLNSTIKLSQDSSCLIDNLNELKEKYICWVLRYCCTKNNDASSSLESQFHNGHNRMVKTRISSSQAASESQFDQPDDSQATNHSITDQTNFSNQDLSPTNLKATSHNLCQSHGNLSMIANVSTLKNTACPKSTANSPTTSSTLSSTGITCFENESFIPAQSNDGNMDNNTLRSSSPNNTNTNITSSSTSSLSQQSSSPTFNVKSPPHINRQQKFAVTLEFLRDYFLDSDPTKTNFVINLMSLGLKLPAISYEIKEDIVQQIRSWLLSPVNRPLFMNEESDSVEANNHITTTQLNYNLNMQAGFQKSIRMLLIITSQVFLLNQSLTNNRPSNSPEEQYEVCKRVLNLFRQVVMATPLNEKSWRCIIITLLHVLKLIHGSTEEVAGLLFHDRTPRNILKFGNHKLLGAFIQTLLVTFIKACLNINMPKELWIELSTILTAFVTQEDLFNEWAKTMDTLFRIYVKHVFELDLVNLPSDRLTEQKAKKRRGQQQLLQENEQIGTQVFEESGRPIRDATNENTGPKLCSDGTVIMRNINKETTTHQTNAKRAISITGQRLSHFVPRQNGSYHDNNNSSTNLEDKDEIYGNTVTPNRRPHSMSVPPSQDTLLLNNMKNLAFHATSMSNPNNPIQHITNGHSKTFNTTSNIPNVDNVTSNQPVTYLNGTTIPIYSIHPDIEDIQNTHEPDVKSLSTLSERHATGWDGTEDLKLLPVMLGGTVTGWNVFTATILWKRMLRLLDPNNDCLINCLTNKNNCSITNSPQHIPITNAILKFRIRYINYLSSLFDKLQKIRDNQYIILSDVNLRNKADLKEAIQSYKLDGNGRIILVPPFQDLLAINFKLCELLSHASNFNLLSNTEFQNLYYTCFHVFFKQFFSNQDLERDYKTLINCYYLIHAVMDPALKIGESINFESENVNTRPSFNVRTYFALLSGIALMNSDKHYAGGISIYSRYHKGSLELLYPLLTKITITLLDAFKGSLNISSTPNSSIFPFPFIGSQTFLDCLNFLGSIIVLSLVVRLPDNLCPSPNTFPRNIVEHKNITLQTYIVRYIMGLKNANIDSNCNILIIKIITVFLIHCHHTNPFNEISCLDIHIIIPNCYQLLFSYLKGDNWSAKLAVIESLNTLILTNNKMDEAQIIPILQNVCECLSREWTSLTHMPSPSQGESSEVTLTILRFMEMALYCVVECTLFKVDDLSVPKDRKDNTSVIITKVFQTLAILAAPKPTSQNVNRSSCNSNPYQSQTSSSIDSTEAIYINSQDILSPKDTRQQSKRNSKQSVEVPTRHEDMSTDIQHPSLKVLQDLATYLSSYLLRNLYHYPLSTDRLDCHIDETYEHSSSSESINPQKPLITQSPFKSQIKYQNLADACQSPFHQFYLLNGKCLLSLSQNDHQVIRMITRDVCGKFVFYFKTQNIPSQIPIKDDMEMPNSPRYPYTDENESFELQSNKQEDVDLLSKVIDIVTRDGALYMPPNNHLSFNQRDGQGDMPDKPRSPKFISHKSTSSNTSMEESMYPHLRQHANEMYFMKTSNRSKRFESIPSNCPSYANEISTEIKSRNGHHQPEDGSHDLVTNNHEKNVKPNLHNQSGSPDVISAPSNLQSFFQCRQLLVQHNFFANPGRSNLNLIKKSNQFYRQLKHLDNLFSRETYKIALIYVSYGQESKNSILSNSYGSELYERFLTGLGTLIDINSHKGFTGGLSSSISHEETTNQEYQPSTNEVNLHAIYYSTPLTECIFHVSTLFNTLPHDNTEISSSDLIHFKMKHIGNDEVHIVWSDHFRDYRPSIIPTEFCDILIIIYPIREYNLFSIRIIVNKNMPSANSHPPTSQTMLNRKSITPNTEIKNLNQQLNNPYFGPLFDGALVDEASLAPLVKQTAINASRFLKQQKKSFQPSILSRADCISNIVDHNKLPSTFQDLAFSTFKTV